jgi:hypothetical protein
LRQRLLNLDQRRSTRTLWREEGCMRIWRVGLAHPGCKSGRGELLAALLGTRTLIAGIAPALFAPPPSSGRLEDRVERSTRQQRDVPAASSSTTTTFSSARLASTKVSEHHQFKGSCMICSRLRHRSERSELFAVCFIGARLKQVLIERACASQFPNQRNGVQLQGGTLSRREGRSCSLGGLFSAT